MIVLFCTSVAAYFSPLVILYFSFLISVGVHSRHWTPVRLSGGYSRRVRVISGQCDVHPGMTWRMTSKGSWRTPTQSTRRHLFMSDGFSLLYWLQFCDTAVAASRITERNCWRLVGPTLQEICHDNGRNFVQYVNDGGYPRKLLTILVDERPKFRLSSSISADSLALPNKIGYLRACCWNVLVIMRIMFWCVWPQSSDSTCQLT